MSQLKFFAVLILGSFVAFFGPSRHLCRCHFHLDSGCRMTIRCRRFIVLAVAEEDYACLNRSIVWKKKMQKVFLDFCRLMQLCLEGSSQ